MFRGWSRYEPDKVSTVRSVASDLHHWESVWASKRFDEVSWYQADPQP